MSGTKQYRNCPGCKKSFYRRDGNCTVCGFSDPAPASFYSDDTAFSRAGHEAKGRTWDSKKHKYVINKG